MDFSATLSEIERMDVNDRIRLVEAIWESIAAEPGELQLTEAQQEELARRLAAHAAAPDEVVSWEDVKAQALARARR